LFFVALAFAVAQTSFGGTISSCANLPSSPVNEGGTLYTQWDCSLYNDASSYTISLTPLETQGGAEFYTNLVSAGYIVVINGDPNTLPDDTTGLYNQSLWEAVLFFNGDQDAGTASDSLTVYWQGAFPTASTVQNYDDILYGPGIDSEFFVQSTGAETVYLPDANNEYDIYATPEPRSMLLGSCLAMLAGVLLRRRSALSRAETLTKLE
jgi:hypothetical protein